MLVKNLYSYSNEVQLYFVCNKSKIGYKQKGGFRYRNPPCDSHGARTHDPNIKSVVLYQLS